MTATAAAVAIVSSTDLPHGITGVKRLREEDAARTCWHSQHDVSIIDAAIDQAQIQKRAAEQTPNGVSIIDAAIDRAQIRNRAAEQAPNGVSITHAAIDQAQIQKRAAEQIPNTRGHNVGWRRGAALCEYIEYGPTPAPYQSDEARQVGKADEAVPSWLGMDVGGAWATPPWAAEQHVRGPPRGD